LILSQTAQHTAQLIRQRFFVWVVDQAGAQLSFGFTKAQVQVFLARPAGVAGDQCFGQLIVVGRERAITATVCSTVMRSGSKCESLA